ncbi:MAG: biosynthetic peptidoglycan transglycosylase, partial [Candidatus Dormiibacterota bacterium]
MVFAGAGGPGNSSRPRPLRESNFNDPSARNVRRRASQRNGGTGNGGRNGRNGSPRSRPRGRWRLWRRAVGSILLASIVVVGCLLGYTLWTVRDLPDPGQKPAFAQPIQVLDRNGKLIGTIDNGDTQYVPLTLAQMGKLPPEAMLAAEDRNFYQHGPLDYGAILRSAAHDVVHGGYQEGGSTITQQVVTISVLNKADRTPLRKMQEAVLATAMERKYSKDQILDMYMNRVPFGHNAYGIGAAAQVFFGVQANQLTVAEAALLAAIVNGPALFDPAVNYAGAHERALYVLSGLVSMGVITPAQEKQAAAENVQGELKFT